MGEFLAGHPAEGKGVAAPFAMVLDDRVHLFYQSCGNGPADAICHAVSGDGLRFERDTTNPIFQPSGTWTVGRAIDAEVVRLAAYSALSKAPDEKLAVTTSAMPTTTPAAIMRCLIDASGAGLERGS